MAESGHVLIGGGGRFLDVDSAFGALMHTSPDAMIGRAVLDVTAPADRAECASAIARLRRTGQPFRISKRFLRDDGSLVWVTNSVSITGGNSAAPIIIATIEPINAQREIRSPTTLLQAAQFLNLSRRERAQVCGDDLASEPAWELLLAAYIREAQGGVFDVATMAAQGGMSLRSATRWLAVLLERDLFELELRQDGFAPKAYRLTMAAHRRFEEYLSLVQCEHDLLKTG